MTTTAMTPELWISSAGRKATHGEMKLSATLVGGVLDVLLDERHDEERDDADRDAAHRRDEEVDPDAQRRDGLLQRERGRGHGDEGRRVVEEGLTLEDGDKPAWQPDATRDGGGRDGVRGSDDTAQGQCRGETDGHEPPGDEPDDDRGEEHEQHRQLDDLVHVAPQIDERDAQRRRVQQRRQETEENHLGVEVDLAHAGGVGERNPDCRQQEGTGEPDPPRHEASENRRGDEEDDGEGDMHPVIMTAGRDPSRRCPAGESRAGAGGQPPMTRGAPR